MSTIKIKSQEQTQRKKWATRPLRNEYLKDAGMTLEQSKIKIIQESEQMSKDQMTSTQNLPLSSQISSRPTAHTRNRPNICQTYSRERNIEVSNSIQFYNKNRKYNAKLAKEIGKSMRTPVPKLHMKSVTHGKQLKIKEPFELSLSQGSSQSRENMGT